MKTLKLKVLVLALVMLVSAVSTTPAHAVSNSTKSNPGYFNDANNSYVYSDIYMGQSMNFSVRGSTWFVQNGTKKNTQIYNKTTVTIAGLGCTIYGLSASQGNKTTYDSATNTQGQTFAGVSGTVSTDQVWYFNMTGTSYGKVWYDGTTRSSSATVTKWI